MTTFAFVLSLGALVLGGATLVRHTSKATLVLLLPKYLGSAWAPWVAVLGVLGAILGAAFGSVLAIIAGVLGAALAADYVRRVTATHRSLERTFGEDWRRHLSPSRAGRLLRRRWSFLVPPAPVPRWSRDVVFGRVPGPERDLLCDVWQPPVGVEPTGTAIVYLHGSAWYLMDKDVLTRPLFRHLASAGHVVVDVAYRLCPEVDAVGMVADAKRAIAWIKAHAAEFGVDPRRVVLAGASAGGHVALLAAYGDRDPALIPEDLRGADTSVMAVVSYYGVPDLKAYGEHTSARLADVEARPAALVRREPGSVASFFNRLLLGRTLNAQQSPPTPPHRQMMRELVGGLPSEVPERYELLSPIHHVSKSCPPTLLLQGAHDSIVPVSSTRSLEGALRQAGVPVVYVESPRTEHAFDLFFPPMASPAAQSALFDLERFLECAGQSLVSTAPSRTAAAASSGPSVERAAQSEGAPPWA